MRTIKKDHKHSFKDLGEYQWCVICGTLRSKNATGVLYYQKPKKLIQANQAAFIKALEDNGIFSKLCCKCKKDKPFSAFGKENQNVDGLRHKCSDCFSEHYYETEQVWKVDYQRKYNKKSNEENIKKSAAKPPEQKRAQIILADAVRTGKIIKPKKCINGCEASTLDGHHPDYSKPLDVLWLCRPCHKKVHRDLRSNRL